MKIAKFVEEVDAQEADQALYKCDPPIGGSEYIVASSIDNRSGRECLLFKANRKGEIVSFCEVGGLKGVTSHTTAFESEGYTVEW